jgi:hypothetical protein
MPSNYPNQVFAILRFFHGGGDGSVALAITDSGSLCVLKFHFDSAARNKEIDLWKTLYDIDCFTISHTTNTCCAMVMPFVVHATLMKNGTPEFKFNVMEWAKEEVVQSLPCPTLDTCTNHLTELWTEMHATVEEIAQIALKNLTDLKFIHRDIKWNHIALLRKFDAETNKFVFKPILIDLVAVETSESVELARQEMHQEAASGLGIKLA